MREGGGVVKGECQDVKMVWGMVPHASPPPSPPPHPPCSFPRVPLPGVYTRVSPQSDGSTPLHLATHKGHVAVVQYLVETAKADVDVKNVSEGVRDASGEGGEGAQGMSPPAPCPSRLL